MKANNSVKNRIFVILALAMILLLAILLYRNIEGKRFCGISILDENEYLRIAKDRIEPGDVKTTLEVLRFNGQKVPYDVDSRTFYVAQNAKDKSFGGRFSSCDTDYKICMVKDDRAGDKPGSIAEGHVFKAALYSDSELLPVSIVFTGLPVVNINSEQDLSPERVQAQIEIWDPYNREIAQIASYSLNVQAGKNENETISFKAFDKDDAFLNLSMLGFKDNHTYKLYPVDNENLLSEAMAYDLWNAVNDVDVLDKEFDFCEVIENGIYKGLYIIGTKLNNHKLGDDDADIAEINNNDTGEEQIGYLDENTINSGEYLLTLQMLEAYANVDNDVCFVELKNGDKYVSPGRIKYCFGRYPNRMRYLEYQGCRADFDNTLSGQRYQIETVTDFEKLWKEKRETVLSDAAIEDLLNRRVNELKNSGYINRNSGEEATNAFSTLLSSRIDFLDSKYDYQKAGQNAEPFDDGGDTDFVGYSDIFVEISDADESRRIKLYFDRQNIYIYLPSYADPNALKLVFDENEYKIAADNLNLNSGTVLKNLPAENHKKLDVTPVSGSALVKKEASYDLTVVQSVNIPAIHIDTANKTMAYLNESRMHREPGYFVCVDENGVIDSKAEIRNIHGRGTSSWSLLQKGYRVNLATCEDVLNMGAGLGWNLVANSYDKTRIRNALAYTLAKDIGIPGAVEYRFADIYFNGEYAGNYILCEDIEIQPSRLDIPEGSVIIERTQVDRFEEDSVFFEGMNSHFYEILNPEGISEDNLNYVRKQMIRIEKLCQECDTAEKYEELKQYVDMESLILHYIVTMIANEKDGNSLSTYYYFSSADGKMYAGPEWDFDLNWGSLGPYVDVEDRVCLNEYVAGFMGYLIDKDFFIEEVRATAEKNREYLLTFPNKVYEYEKLISNSYDMSTGFLDTTDATLVSFSDKQDNYDYLKANVEGRINLLLDYFDNPDNYHKIFIGGYEGYVFFTKDEKAIPTEVLNYLYEKKRVEKLVYQDGSDYDLSRPITEDLVLDIVIRADK